jgi:hypothetical protein
MSLRNETNIGKNTELSKEGLRSGEKERCRFRKEGGEPPESLVPGV